MDFFPFIVISWAMINFLLMILFAKVFDDEKYCFAMLLLLAEIVCGSILLVVFAPSHPTDVPSTGEIIKFYANGTVLVDNGTVMPWPYGGCGK